jgi:hypothetical protein
LLANNIAQSRKERQEKDSKWLFVRYMVIKWLAGFLGYRPVSQFSTKLNCVSLRTLRDIY